VSGEYSLLSKLQRLKHCKSMLQAVSSCPDCLPVYQLLQPVCTVETGWGKACVGTHDATVFVQICSLCLG